MDEPSKKEQYLDHLEETLLNNGKTLAYTQVCKDYANRLLENKVPVIFDTKHLSLLLGIDRKFILSTVFQPELQYREKIIPKRSGGERILSMPSATLKYAQRWVLDNILATMHVSDYATGFCRKKSILTNAEFHLNKECVINVDIENFFPSITFDQVFRIFFYYGYTKEVSYILTSLCVYKNSLPQGSPASPCLANIVCLKLDKRLSELSKSFKSSYTRYADDITISGKRGISDCIPIVKHILNEEGFLINEKKTRVAYKHERQEVTGLVVNNERPKVSRKYCKQLFQDIYYCKRYGVSSHMEKIECTKMFYKEHLYGKAYFLYMIEPQKGAKALAQLDQINWGY